MITLPTCVDLFAPQCLMLNHWNNLHGTILKIFNDEFMIDEFISPFRNPFYPLMLKIALNKFQISTF
jgi:hypothetical protein